jgi:hypothetical protein
MTNRRVTTTVIRRNDDGTDDYTAQYFLDGRAAGGTLRNSDYVLELTESTCYFQPAQFPGLP